MAKAKIVKQLSFVLPNKVGQLAAVTELVASEKVSITSLSARELGNNAEFFLTTDANAKAKRALASLGVEIKEGEAVRMVLPDKSGRLFKVAKRLADAGVDVRSAWAAASPSGKSATVMVISSDNEKAAAAINKEAPKEPKKAKAPKVPKSAKEQAPTPR